MPRRCFLDTNIFVYTFDERAPAKQVRARELMFELASNGVGIVSYQVVQEFLNVMTRNFARPLSAVHLQEYLLTVLWPMCEVFPSPELYATALGVREDTGYSFYDCLMISAALESECKVLYTEDLQSRHKIRGLEIRNPFLLG